VVRRSVARSRAGDVQPFWHMPPLLVGKSRPAAVTVGASPSATVCSVCAHCSAQYGQCVAAPSTSTTAGTDIR
jgi:hypothetical protein